MGANSKISWTHHTFNPWWGCTKVSPGCAHCYAETFSKRTGHDVWGNGTHRFFGDKHWAEPVKWNSEALELGERRRVFCASMADVFEEGDDRHLELNRLRLWTLIEETPNLDWLVLTKRPENVEMFLRAIWNKNYPPNFWIGTSVENQEMADKRLPALAQIPAQVRFISAEPLISPVNLGLEGTAPQSWGYGYVMVGELIHWVIVGGESGVGYRPFEKSWARDIKRECEASGVTKFFMKQLGGNPYKRDQLEDFPEDLRIQEWPR